jgi:hypothetical protein
MEEFSAGQVLSRGVSVWLKNFVPFTILSVLCFLPDFIFTYFAVKDGLQMSPNVFAFITTVLTWLLGMVATSAITYGVFQQLRGQPASLGDSISVGIGRIFGVLGTSILAGVAIGGGMLLLVVPGVIIATALFVAVPAAVVEKEGGLKALHRSAFLTKGHRWGIFGISVLVAVVNYGCTKIVTMFMESDIKSGNFSFARATAYLLGIVGVAAILAPMTSALSAVAYHDLRRAKEGADIEQLAAVFD